MTHYLNFIEEEDDIDDDIEEVEEEVEDDDEEEEDEDEEVIIKINKRLIPRDYTFYKIHKNGCENYIGSTVNLYKRKNYHKSCCNNEKSTNYNFPVYKYIRENGGYNSFDYEILDTRFCSKVDAEIYEGELMRINKSTLNIQRNYTDADKKKHKKIYKKIYQKTDKYKDYQKEYKKTDKRKEYQKKYYQNKKQEKINLTINIQNLNINLPQD